ncbi:hypothetical protein F4779DRAFT_81726 [Xylariaceae sp. FL0662B]|nr:hypothetical protein F4779DRAFT_81726 [Xylariaceae sp. FL0662B]
MSTSLRQIHNGTAAIVTFVSVRLVFSSSLSLAVANVSMPYPSSSSLGFLVTPLKKVSQKLVKSNIQRLKLQLKGGRWPHLNEREESPNVNCKRIVLISLIAVRKTEVMSFFAFLFFLSILSIETFLVLKVIFSAILLRYISNAGNWVPQVSLGGVSVDNMATC